MTLRCGFLPSNITHWACLQSLELKFIAYTFLARLQLCFNEMFSFTLKIGPVPPAFDDFWRMVWEKQSVTIIMLTNLQERHQVSEPFSFIKQRSIEACLSIGRSWPLKFFYLTSLLFTTESHASSPNEIVGNL